MQTKPKSDAAVMSRLQTKTKLWLKLKRKDRERRVWKLSVSVCMYVCVCSWVRGGLGAGRIGGFQSTGVHRPQEQSSKEG